MRGAADAVGVYRIPFGHNGSLWGPLDTGSVGVSVVEPEPAVAGEKAPAPAPGCCYGA